MTPAPEERQKSQTPEGERLYHMLDTRAWQAVDPALGYRPPSLTSEGFIHCSGSRAALMQVANAFYHKEPGDWCILSIDPARVVPEVRWEPADGRQFPHLYGALNVDAVVEVLPFPRAADGTFLPPPSWGEAEGAQRQQATRSEYGSTLDRDQ